MESFVWRGREVALFDLSDTVENATSVFEPNGHEISYVDHARGKEIGAELFAGVLGIPREATDKMFPREHAWAVEEAKISTHSGTHTDAPYHYGPQTKARCPGDDSEPALSGEDTGSKEQASGLLQDSGWTEDSIADLGGISSAKGSEHYFRLFAYHVH